MSQQQPLTWVDPPSEKGSNHLFLLTGDEFWAHYIFMPADLTPLRERLQKGEPPGDVLGPKAFRVSLAALTSVKCDRRRGDLALGWSEADAQGKPRARGKAYFLSNPPARDAIYDALRARLGPEWEETAEDGSRVFTAVGGVALLAAGLLGLYLLRLLFHWLLTVQVSGRPSANWAATAARWLFRLVIQPVLELLGPTGGDYLFLGVAAVMALVAVFMTADQVRKPALFVTLKPRPSAG